MFLPLPIRDLLLANMSEVTVPGQSDFDKHRIGYRAAIESDVRIYNLLYDNEPLLNAADEISDCPRITI